MLIELRSNFAYGSMVIVSKFFCHLIVIVPLSPLASESRRHAFFLLCCRRHLIAMISSLSRPRYQAIIIMMTSFCRHQFIVVAKPSSLLCRRQSGALIPCNSMSSQRRRGASQLYHRRVIIVILSSFFRRPSLVILQSSPLIESLLYCPRHSIAVQTPSLPICHSLPSSHRRYYFIVLRRIHTLECYKFMLPGGNMSNWVMCFALANCR